MTKYFCNPININYKYQFCESGDTFSLNREAADPSMVLFKGKYYLFPSMTNGFLVSNDLINWTMFPMENLPVYDFCMHLTLELLVIICIFVHRAEIEFAIFIELKILKVEISNASQGLLTFGIQTYF